MAEKTTYELEQEIRAAGRLEDYLEENQSELLNGQDLTALLRDCLAASGLSRAELVRRSGLNRAYVYQIFLGRKLPSRDKVIALAVGMGLSVQQIQRLLKAAGYRELYARDPRDAVILFGLNDRRSVMEINEQLFEHTLAVLE